MTRSPHRLLDGPPVTLPARLDRAVDAWWATGPRTRVALVALAGTLALVVGLATVTAAAPGPPVRVHLATRTLLPGDVLTATDVRSVDWPEDLVPTTATRGRAAPLGVVRALVPAGTVLTTEHLGEDGPRAGIDDDAVAVAIPIELVPALRPGDTLLLVGPDGHGGGQALTDRGVVVHEDSTHLWVAVPARDAVAVSAATASGSVTVAIRGP